MSLSDAVIANAAQFTRAIPYFRGLGTIYRKINGAMLNAGIDPIRQVQMKRGYTMAVDLRSNTEIDAFYRGTYDPDRVEILRVLFDPRGCFLDVGANVGFYSVALAWHLRATKAQGKVLSFEPLNSNFARLNANLKLNALEDLVSTYNLGLSNRCGETSLVLREDFAHGGAGTGNASIAIGAAFDHGFAQVPIRLARLDDIWSECNPTDLTLDIVKIDIEGHEDLFLEGARSILEKNRPTILMEINKPYYRARGVAIDEVFPPLFPKDCLVFRNVDQCWVNVKMLDDCLEIDNVFVVPSERLSDPRFALFNT